MKRFGIVIAMLFISIVRHPLRSNSNSAAAPQMQNIVSQLKEQVESPTFYNLNVIEYKDLTSRAGKALLVINEGWSRALYIIEINAKNEIQFSDIVADGLDNVFETNEINISQGDFVEVYNAGHMGTGHLSLYSLDSPYMLTYEIPGIIDRNHEGIPVTVKDLEQNEILIDEDGLARQSKIFEHDKLTATYEDINLDGATDIVLRGIERTVLEMKNGSYITNSEAYCKYVYLYDKESDEFAYSEENSVYLELNSVLDS